ncbi:MAG: SCO family protein [Cytophagia bacterium]|nr:MAG: SCO family protein [Cytophagales bacterium]TAG39619.1 MAG: SCO family protein [Cytophagia bacterium]TAG61667.1 MAG: SCO family protein [Runella slithyformis]TAG81197.1 MAG: SCO family protein [Cytophagales bacterium]
MNIKLWPKYVALVLCLAACGGNDNERLPIWGEREPITKIVNGKETTDTLYHTIPAFKFVNQYGDTVTQETVKGKIYVADFFFTTCPTICPVMKRQMLKVYQKFKGDPDIVFLSHSIDPAHDTPAVLKKYADELGVTGNQWQFLTGNRTQIYDISKSYLVAQTPAEDSTAEGGFVHDGTFILIDKQGRVRATNQPYTVIDKEGIKQQLLRYDGTTDEGVNKLMEDIEKLRKEYY